MSKLVMVLNTGNHAKVAVLKTVLEDENIRYVVKGEFLYRSRSIQVLVHQADEERVLAILKKFDNKKGTAA